MILKRGLDRVLVPGAVPDQQPSPPITHEHVRGADYFDTEPRPRRDDPPDDTGTLH